MALHLISGKIGSGKSARVVWLLLDDERYTNKAVFSHGIEFNEIDVPIQRIYCRSNACLVCRADPMREKGLQVAEWYEWCQPDTVIVVDEAHHAWPQRREKDAPESVVRLRESRKFGVDFIIVTQDLMFLDIDVRRLATCHEHVDNHSAGRTLLRWDEYQQDVKDHSNAAKTPYILPKKVFPKYKSAALHTLAQTKKKLPFKVKFVLGALLVMVLGLGTLLATSDIFAGGGVDLIGNQSTELPAVVQAGEEAAAVTDTRGAAPSAPSPAVGVQSVAAAFVPSDPAYPETAPAYGDQVVVPVSVPRLAGCVSDPDRCICYSSDGRRYRTTRIRCQRWLEGLEFPWWTNPD